MIKELRIGDKGSFSDFGQCISKRSIGIPAKKIIKETVPFKNGDYDFSALNGEPAYEDREISYTFDVIGTNMLEVEKQKKKLLDWLMNVQNENIYDPYIENFHFYGSYNGPNWSENWEQSELTVTFKVYPYLISNSPFIKKFKLKAGSNKVQLHNNGSHQIIPKITTNNPIDILVDNTKYSLNVGLSEDDNFLLKKGINEMIINTTSDTEVEFQYTIEVF